MSVRTAIIDATDHDDSASIDAEVAGVGLLERTLRLADVSECDSAVVCVESSRRDEAERVVASFRADERWDLDVELRTTDGNEDSAFAAARAERMRGGALYLDSTHAFERGMVQDCASRAAERGGIWTVRPEGGRPAPMFAAGARGVSTLLDHARAESIDPVELVAQPENRPRGLNVRVADDEGGWVEEIDSPRSADRASERIWQGCYKPVDGPISRRLNRPISLAITRRLASTGIRPNHMSAVTFLIGIAAALAVGVGGFWWFLLGGVLYQATSILDGVDGELARGKYEFSLTGAWVDTLCDNFKDIFFYLGLGYGAYKTVPLGFEGSAAEVWLWLGALAAIGKFLSLAGYSVWMIPRGVGCPLYFDWGDDQEEATEMQEEGLVDRIVATFELLSKNDVVLFAAFAMSLVGLLPWFLLFVAVGHHIVAVSIGHRLLEIWEEPEPQTEASTEPPESIA